MILIAVNVHYNIVTLTNFIPYTFLQGIKYKGGYGL